MDVHNKKDCSAKIRELLEFVFTSSRSNFYRDKYLKANFDYREQVRKSEEISNIPLLTRSELASTLPDERMYFELNGLWNVSATSGTSSKKPAYFFFKTNELHRDPVPNRCEDRILLIKSPSRLPRFFQNMEGKGKLFVIGNSYNFSETANQARIAGVQCILASPSILLAFAEHLKKVYMLSNVTYIRCTGEQMTAQKYLLIRQQFPNATIECTYALTETKTIGIQCTHLIESGTYHLYHAITDKFLYETTEEGELVITTLTYENYGTPLIRYKTGDKAKFQTTLCKCGSPEPLFEIQGRMELDMIKTGGGIITKDQLEIAIAQLSTMATVKDYILEIGEIIEEGKCKTSLMLKLQLDTKNAIDLAKIENVFTNTFRVGTQSTLAAAISKGYFTPLQLFVSEDSVRSPGEKQEPIVMNTKS